MHLPDMGERSKTCPWFTTTGFSPVDADADSLPSLIVTRTGWHLQPKAKTKTKMIVMTPQTLAAGEPWFSPRLTNRTNPASLL